MEWLEFYVVVIPHFPLVLVLEWLQTHDPCIVWSIEFIHFDSSGYCLHWPHVYKTEKTLSQPLDLLPEIEDYADVFWWVICHCDK